MDQRDFKEIHEGFQIEQTLKKWNFEI